MTHTQPIRPGIQRIRPRPGPPPRRRTYLAAAAIDGPEPLIIDDALWNGFVTVVGTHARDPAVTVHDLSIAENGYWILLSGEPASCRPFLDGVAHDLTLFLWDHLGDVTLSVAQDPPLRLGRPMRGGAPVPGLATAC